jgi:hypothetical protein
MVGAAFALPNKDKKADVRTDYAAFLFDLGNSSLRPH